MVSSDLVGSWAALYSHSKVLSSAVRFLHLAGMLVAGGAALTYDRLTFLAARGTPVQREQQLALIEGAHGIVLAGMAVVIVTGVLMFAADTETFLPSRLFWFKMALFALLAVNGALLVRARRWLKVTVTTGWKALVTVSAISLTLWLTTTLLGTLLGSM
jgi:uncharacterized membrane protein